MRGFRKGRPHPDATHLFLSIPKLILFKKLTARDGDRKILKPTLFTFYFCFYFFIFVFIFIFIILKLIYFIKNKNIMNF